MDLKMDISLRRSYRAQLTKLCNNVKDIIKSPDILSEDLSVTCEKIKLLRLSLSKLNEKITPSITDDTSLQSECDKIAEYEFSAMEAIASLEVSIRRKLLEEHPDSSRLMDVARSSAGNHMGNQEQQLTGNINIQANQQKMVRLPKLDLLKFNGDLEAWPTFWEQYTQAIHNNTDLDNNAKLTYLKSLLTGKAAFSISGLTSNQNVYNDAVDLLKNEYGQSERIVDCYVQKLCSLPHVKYDKDITALRRLYNTASSITRSLESLGISAEQYGLMVKSMIFNVLPYNLRVQFNKYKINCQNDNESQIGSESGSVVGDSIDYNKQIKHLLNFIKIEVDSLEQAHGNSSNEKAKTFDKNKVKKSNNFRDNYFTKHNETVTAQGLLNITKDCCLFCKSKNHETKNCKSSTITLNDKKKILKDNSRCFRCTGSNHRSKFCKTRDISCVNCNGRHVTTMCDPSFKRQFNNEPNSEQSTVTALSNERLDNVYLQTACVFVKSGLSHNDLLVRAIIDGGSQLTFIRQCVSRELDLPVVGTHKISVCSFGSSQKGVAKLCNKVEVLLRSQYNNKLIKIHAIEAPQICFDAIQPPSRNDPVIQRFSKNHQLADIKTNNLDMDGLSLLIGADNYWLIVNSDIKYLTNKLTAVHTKFGWTIHGASDCNETTTNFSVNFNITTILHAEIIENNEPDLTMFWDLERIGINANEIKKIDNFTEHFIENNVIFKDNRYEVTLPWISDKILDSNYVGTLVRFKNLVNKLCKNSQLVEYDQAIRQYMNLECAETVIEIDNKQNDVYYMPHRPVYRRDKETSQVRVVFDASAHAPGMPSLNDKLLTGENLIPDLLKISLNFRVGRVGLIADIEKAFLQISLCNEDRDYHRFLWFKNPIEREVMSIYQLPEFQVFRMCRVTFGVTTSPFLLAVTLRKHLLEQPDQEFGKLLLESFYVDDFMIAATNEEEALTIYDRAKAIMAEANMNLRKWSSNNSILASKFINDIKNDSSKVRSNEEKKVLGINWCTVTDTLSVDIQRILNDAVFVEPTKRIILKTIASIFDPLGVLCAFTVKIKILLQRIWKANLKWDEPLPNDFKLEWTKWFQDVSNLNEFSIPRCVLSNKSDPVELHLFADASPLAFGVIAYIKCLKNSECNFLVAKNRVSPLKQNLTLPKLELTAALCAARLQKYIVKNIVLNIREVFLWSDSKISLYWIKGRKSKWKPFIQNRVNEIQTMENVTWKYCPGKDNPADSLTRGIPAVKLLKNSEHWLHGPEWLRLEKINWPNDEQLDENIILTCLVEAESNLQPMKFEPELQPIFDMNHYSNYDKMLRVTAIIFRFLNNVNKTKSKITGNFNTNEIERAEYYWIRLTQQQEYPEELISLKKKREISKKSSILTLTPFLDENEILRLGGRLHESNLSFSEKHPIILPKSSNLTLKIIWQSHMDSMHGGINATLTFVRRKFWIIRARQKIKATISKCVICKKLKGKHGIEAFAPLPKDRISMAQPFNITGIDFAGPLYIKTNNDQKSKVYIMLFTCAVIRAIHLELVDSLSTESCVLGLRRFIARRGVPSTIYSDNAKTFKRTALELNELSSILQGKEVQDLAQKKRIKWKFSIERGSWWGGFWERLVRSVKNALKSVLGRRFLHFDELQTILTEVEATVNSRPLSYIDEDPTNIFILTPSKFLIGESDIGFSPDLKSVEIGQNEILKTWKIRQATVDKFWKIWQRDYLQQLRSAHFVENLKPVTIKEGDIVLLQDENKPRLIWKMVRVTQLFQGRDGKTRACEILSSDGTRLKRPIQCLYPLEVRSCAPGEDVKNMTNS